jgi:hypothetical protein
VLRAPGQVAAQVGLGVVAGGTLEPGQVGSHRQPQLISERHQMIGRDRRKVGEVHHAQTLRLTIVFAALGRVVTLAIPLFAGPGPC